MRRNLTRKKKDLKPLKLKPLKILTKPSKKRTSDLPENWRIHKIQKNRLIKNKMRRISHLKYRKCIIINQEVQIPWAKSHLIIKRKFRASKLKFKQSKWLRTITNTRTFLSLRKKENFLTIPPILPEAREMAQNSIRVRYLVRSVSLRTSSFLLKRRINALSRIFRIPHQRKCRKWLTAQFLLKRSVLIKKTLRFLKATATILTLWKLSKNDT